MSASEYTQITSTKKEHTTLYERKFSDYEYINFELIVGGLIRETHTIPRRRFSTYSVELAYVNSANTQFWCNVAFSTDTSYYVQGSSNLGNNAYVCITGLKALM